MILYKSDALDSIVLGTRTIGLGKTNAFYTINCLPYV